MGVHSLALSLAILALFTLSSVVFFEIFTQPSVIRQERESFITPFTSDQQFSDYVNYEQPLGHLSDRTRGQYSKHSASVSTASARNSGSIQEAVTRSTVSDHANVTKESLSSLKPLSMLMSKIKNKNALMQRNGTSVVPKLVTKPTRLSRLSGMQQFAEDASRNNTQLVRRERYVSISSTSTARVNAQLHRTKISKRQPGQIIRHKYVNRNNTRALKLAARKLKRISPGRPRRLGLNCTDAYCVSYLRDEDYRSFSVCQQWAEKKTRVDHKNINATCKFMKGVSRLPVGLVSVPGSGNTWVRGLLEKATGICTGSIYCDHPLRNGGMIGEYVKSGSVLVVKTHTSDYQWKDVEPEQRNKDDAFYGSAILLIRNPFNAFIAEWNRVNALSSYLGHPVERGKFNRSSIHTKRAYLIGRANHTKVRSMQNYRYKTLMRHSSLQKAKLDRARGSKHTGEAVQLNSKMLTGNHEPGNDSVPFVGRKLLAFTTNKRLKVDVSHTLEVDKKMFGKNMIINSSL